MNLNNAVPRPRNPMHRRVATIFRARQAMQELRRQRLPGVYRCSCSEYVGDRDGEVGAGIYIAVL
jgi:hypothetical protein